jgi:hypothetical protein
VFRNYHIPVEYTRILNKTRTDQLLGHRSQNSIVAQHQNCPFGVNTMNDLRNVTAISDDTAIERDMFQVTNVPIMAYVAVTFSSSTVVLTLNGSFWIMPLLHSVRDIFINSLA